MVEISSNCLCPFSDQVCTLKILQFLDLLLFEHRYRGGHCQQDEDYAHGNGSGIRSYVTPKRELTRPGHEAAGCKRTQIWDASRQQKKHC